LELDVKFFEIECLVQVWNVDVSIVPRKALKLAENVSLIAEEVWDQGGL